ncbi:MAG: hypothetical protein JWN18_674 [Parcubacteria group bacterium]|nr:hypothetical protein [Parcubacteria group bacterium]
MELVNYYRDVLRKYADFTGRSSRREYWYFVLANLIIYIVFGLFGSAGKAGSNLYGFLVLVPSIAVTVRRFHDTNRSGWCALVLYVGVIILGMIFVGFAIGGVDYYLFLFAIADLVMIVALVWLLASNGDLEANKYGISPKRNASAYVSAPTRINTDTPPTPPRL